MTGVSMALVGLRHGGVERLCHHLKSVNSMLPVLQYGQFEVRHTIGRNSRMAPAIAVACLARANSSTAHVGAATPMAGGVSGTMRE